MDTTIINTGDGNIINTGSGGRNVDAEIQVSGSSQQGAENSDGTPGKEVETEVGSGSGDNQVSSKIQNKIISSQGVKSDEEKSLDLYIDASISKDLAAYNALTIIRLFPKAYEKFSAYCKDKANGDEGVDSETVMALLLAAPRTVLPDFFDKNGIYANTWRRHDTGFWGFEVKSSSGLIKSEDDYDRRVLAEVDAFNHAFIVLENK